MIKKTILLICYLLPAICFGQQSKNDSLRIAASREKNDSIKAFNYNVIGRNFWYVNTDSSLYYTDKAEKIAREKKIYGVLPYCYNNYGVIAFFEADYLISLKKYFEGLKYSGSNKRITGILLNNIGMTYDELRDYPKALEYYRKTLELKKQKGDVAELASTYNNIGSVSLNLNQMETGKLYYDTAALIARKYNDKLSLADALGNIGNYYYYKKNYSEAEKYCNESLEIKKGLGNVYGYVTSASNLALIMIDSKKYKEAERLLREMEDLCTKNHYSDQLYVTYNNLARLYTFKNDCENSLIYLSKSISIKDTLLADSKLRDAAVKEKEYAYSVEQVKDSLENEHQKAQTKLIHEKELHEQKLYSYGGMIVAGLMIIVAIVVFRAFREKQRSNEIITQQKLIVENQKHLIEEKHREMMDSINYAKRIQKALITNEYYIQKSMERMRR